MKCSPHSDWMEPLSAWCVQAAHVMAMAVQRLFPDARTTIGPCIENGFYYDFDIPEPLSDCDLKRIKSEMVKIIKADLPFVLEEVRPVYTWSGHARSMPENAHASCAICRCHLRRQGKLCPASRTRSRFWTTSLPRIPPRR